jgi:hypothetical protein
MTSLAITLSVDSRGPTAIYIMTDSRLTWERTSQCWDFAQKTFASSRTPDVFGFWGEALFPPMILRQILDQINCGLIFSDNMNAAQRHEILSDGLRSFLSQRGRAPVHSFSIFHGAREGEHMKSRFRLWETRYNADSSNWSDRERDLNTDHSYFAHVDGSGRDHVVKRSLEWIGTDAQGTSRSAIWSFCNALNEGKDVSSGGPPQLVGIWRKGPAQSFGFWWKGHPYLSGAEVPKNSEFGRVNWFNHRFERVDGRTGKRIVGAQKHRNPPGKDRGTRH